MLGASAGALAIPSKRRIAVRRILLITMLLVSASVIGWALIGPDHLRHTAARSFRSAIGPPPPAPLELIVADDDDRGDRAQAAAPALIIPTAAPEPAAPPPSPPPDPPADLRGVSFVLLLGADNRSDKVTGRTDAMIMAAFRHSDGKVAAFSMPRDLWVALPDVGTLHEQGRTHARLSSVVRVGEVRVGRGQGMALLRRTIHEQFGVRVDRFASIDFGGFVGLVDEFDGVDVDVECPIVDCFWDDGPEASGKPCTMMTIEAGRVHMDGETALEFVRSRHGRGDHDRTRRQQAVILAFARKVRARGLRGLRALWREAEPFVTTDITAEDAAYYASFALENELRDIRGFAIRHPMTGRHVTDDGKHVMLLDRPAFDRALTKLFEGKLPALAGRTRCPQADLR